MTTKKALVLSGGGGRGAYHIGVIEALIQHGWIEDGKGPDIIAGTSIGAINAAALASGLTIEQLKQYWLAMHTEEVHRLSNDIPPFLRPLLRFLMRSVLTSNGHNGYLEMLPEEARSMSAPSFLSKLGTLFEIRPFRSLLDTTPWRHTLSRWMNFERINSPDSPTLLLTATEIQSGALQIFCNRGYKDQGRSTITLDHLMASSSIPIIYPWTAIDTGKYWDGAVLSNTPLGPIIDLAGDDDLDIIVVLMTPWHEDPNAIHVQQQSVPQDLLQAITLTLDWVLLASYRVAMKQLRRCNELVEASQKLERAVALTGDDTLCLACNGRRYVSEPTVIAPEDLMPLEWIIDYEEETHRKLFALGRADAERALAKRRVQ